VEFKLYKDHVNPRKVDIMVQWPLAAFVVIPKVKFRRCAGIGTLIVNSIITSKL